jgi:hypothetical protein
MRPRGDRFDDSFDEDISASTTSAAFAPLVSPRSMTSFWAVPVSPA